MSPTELNEIWKDIHYANKYAKDVSKRCIFLSPQTYKHTQAIMILILIMRLILPVYVYKSAGKEI